MSDWQEAPDRCSNCRHWHKRFRRSGDCTQFYFPVFNYRKGHDQELHVRTTKWCWCRFYESKETTE